MLGRKLKIIPNAWVLLAAFCSSPAIAGPDWFIVQEAHRMLAQRAIENKGIVSKPVMPLDHGPRALTTPWLNQQMAAHAKDALAQMRKDTLAASNTNNASLSSHL